MDGSERVISQALLNDFFRAIFDRRFNDAEKVLQEIEANITCDEDEFKHGFIRALKGIILMSRSDDQYVFLSKLNVRDVEALKKYHREFLDEARRILHSEYDRGYFSALAEYIRFILRNAGFR